MTDTSKEAVAQLVERVRALGFSESADTLQALARERDEAREFGEKAAKAFNDAAANRIITCVYCGFEYPAGTPQSHDARLTEHIKVCEKHPMRALQAQHDALLAALNSARDNIQDLCRQAHAMKDGSFYSGLYQGSENARVVVVREIAAIALSAEPAEAREP